MAISKALTDNGFVRPTYDDLLNRQTQKAKELFGADIDTGELTPLGKFIRLTIYDLAQAYEELEIAYFARFPNTSSGQSLDRLMPFAGITRNPATAARHKVTLTGTPNYIVSAGFLVGTKSGINFHVFDETRLDEQGKAFAVVECTVRGESGNVPIGSITDIINPSMDVLSVSNSEVVSLGEKAESDYALRIRFMNAVAGSGSATLDSIRGAIMRIQNVKGVLIDENDTDDTNANGVPRRSFETFVLAPKELFQDIADAIFSKKPIGIKTYGDNEVEVVDKGGFAHTVRFSWTNEIIVHLKIKVNVNNFFESTGDKQILDNVVQYIASHVNGQTVVLTSIYGYIYDVSGVAQVTELLMSHDGGVTFSSENVQCGFNEIPRLPVENISLEVVKI